MVKIIYNGREFSADANGDPVMQNRKKGFPLTAVGWPVEPKSLRWGPRFLYERYKLPIYITENGMADVDLVTEDGKVHDLNRIEFLQRYLTCLEQATDDGVDVGGYFVWTFMDNFEWSLGYTPHFGLVHVDFETQQRTPKDSAYWYKNWIESRWY